MLRAALLLRAGTLPKLVSKLSHTALRRSFSTTSFRYADPKDGHEIAQKSFSHPALQKVLESPEVIDSLRHLAQILQKNGVRLDEGKLPGPMSLIKILSMPEVREATQVTMEKFKAAGINMDAKTALEIFKSMKL